MPNTPFQDLLKAYFENDEKIQGQSESISRIGRGGTAENYLRGAASPLSEKDLEQVDQLFAYAEKKEVLRIFEAERDALAIKINDVLSVIRDKKVLYKKKIVQIAALSVREVTVAIWSDGSKLHIEEHK